MGRKDKKSVPIFEAPPPATSLSEDDDDSDSDAATATSSDAVSSDEDLEVSLLPKNPPSTTPASKQPIAIPFAEDSDDDSDDSPPPKTKLIPSAVKSAAKQPKSSSSKPTTTSGVTVAALPSSKRPAESENKVLKKRVKKDKSDTPVTDQVVVTPTGPASGPGLGTAATPQKKLFERLWSDEDEIVILKGMIEYKSKKGIDPMSNVEDFLVFIKKSLHVPDANKGQIVSKVRRLKKRFENAKQKKLTNPHELNAFVLSKQIWGGLEIDSDNTPKDDDTTKKAAGAATNGEVAEKKVVEEKGGVKVAGKVENVVDVEDAAPVDVDFGFSGSNWAMLRTAMAMMGEEEKGELKKMVDKAKEAFLKADLLRLEADSLRQKVVEAATKKVLDGVRSEE